MIMFSGKNTIFPDNTRKIIFQRYFFGKTIFSGRPEKENMVFRAVSLTNLVDNLSEIHKEECKACINGKNIKSESDFIEHKNNNLRFECKECERIWLKPSLPSIANSLSESNKKKYTACMEKENIKSKCDFPGIKDTNLSYKCKKI